MGPKLTKEQLKTCNPASKKIWMIWELGGNCIPVLRAICTSEASAIVRKWAIENGGDRLKQQNRTIHIETNLTNHLFGEYDYEVAGLYMRANRENIGY